MVDRASLHNVSRTWVQWVGRLDPRKVVVAGAALLALLLYLTTLQHEVNGSRSPYATDVGEIQNALPRWGIIHFNGYPLYSLLGSAFVTAIRPLGIAPAAGSSLFSALWGAAAVGLLAALALAFAVPPLAAGAGALLFALSASMWIDASVAEVHTMSVTLTLGAILAAVQFGRYGRRRDLLWLAFLAGQVVAHQPASLLLAPALAILAFHRWRAVRGVLWRSLPAAVGLGLLGPLTYLYLPLRVWQGADWVFGSPGTWEGFRHLALDSKSYVVTWPRSGAEWLKRARTLLALLDDDLPLSVLALGLLALVGLARPGRASAVEPEDAGGARQGGGWEALGLTLVWMPNLALSVVIWENQVSDALLASKLPVVAMAALGVALVARPPVSLHSSTVGRGRWLWALAGVLWLALAAGLYVAHRPAVLEIVRDPEAREVVATAAQIEPAPDGKPVVLTALWGVDYWALAYAQAYGDGPFPFELVKHDADLPGILAREEHLLVLGHLRDLWPLPHWEGRLGRLYLSLYAPGVIEMRARPLLDENALPPGTAFALGNGVEVLATELEWRSPDALWLTVHWRAVAPVERDYSVAVHLVSQDPPAGPEDILVQADRDHPVGGWYPTGRWTPGEIVRDIYPLPVPGGAAPRAVRLCMYRVVESGQFENTAWLSIPVPEG